MKRRTGKAAAPAQPPAPPDPRERLREFAAFVEMQDPAALAAEVTRPHDTLMHCARIERFFRKYKAVLKARVIH